MENAAAYLRERGWKLKHPEAKPSVSSPRVWMRTDRTSAGNRKVFLDEESESMPREWRSSQVYQYAELAIVSASEGRLDLALGYSWMAGFFGGHSNLKHRESRKKSAAKKDKYALPDATYVAAISAASTKSARPRVKDILNELRERGDASDKTHYSRIRALRNKAIP
jgi:hypothetical protein